MTTEIPTWQRLGVGASQEKVYFAVCLDGVVQQVMTLSPQQAGLWVEQPTVVLCNAEAQPGDTVEIATAGL